MASQDDFDQQLTSPQEYGIAFAVIALFGAMYWYFADGFLPASDNIVKSGSVFSSVVERNSVSQFQSANAEPVASLEKETNDVSLKQPSRSKSVASETVSASQATTPDVLNKAPQVSISAPLNNAKIKAQAAKLAAATVIPVLSSPNSRLNMVRLVN